jgi:succinyl-CoA synthetase alpha subunit
MGNAGAIISGGKGSSQDKIIAIEKVGVTVTRSSEITFERDETTRTGLNVWCLR